MACKLTVLLICFALAFSSGCLFLERNRTREWCEELRGFVEFQGIPKQAQAESTVFSDLGAWHGYIPSSPEYPNLLIGPYSIANGVWLGFTALEPLKEGRPLTLVLEEKTGIGMESGNGTEMIERIEVYPDKLVQHCCFQDVELKFEVCFNSNRSSLILVNLKNTGKKPGNYSLQLVGKPIGEQKVERSLAAGRTAYCCFNGIWLATSIPTT